MNELLYNFLTDDTKEKLLACEDSFEAYILGLGTMSKKEQEINFPQIIHIDNIIGITIPGTTKYIIPSRNMEESLLWRNAKDYSKALGGDIPDVLTALHFLECRIVIQEIIKENRLKTLPSSFWIEETAPGRVRLGLEITDDQDNTWAWAFYNGLREFKKSNYFGVIPFFELP